jgi:hypothetical protein
MGNERARVEVTGNLRRKLEEQLSRTDKPMTCTELMKCRGISKEALRAYGGGTGNITAAASKLSNLLGQMWRSGQLIRYPAPETCTSFARYAYEWSLQPPAKAQSQRVPIRILGRQAAAITETLEGAEIDFDKFTITVLFKS